MVDLNGISSFILFVVSILPSFVVIVDATSSDVKYNEKNRNQDDANNKRFTLSTIEDVEMLTYFLLWKHDYFDNTPDLNNIQGLFVLTYSEYRLLTFYLKLKVISKKMLTVLVKVNCASLLKS